MCVCVAGVRAMDQQVRESARSIYTTDRVFSFLFASRAREFIFCGSP